MQHVAVNTADLYLYGPATKLMTIKSCRVVTIMFDSSARVLTLTGAEARRSCGHVLAPVMRLQVATCISEPTFFAAQAIVINEMPCISRSIETNRPIAHRPEYGHS